MSKGGLLKRMVCLALHFTKPTKRDFKTGSLTCSRCGLDWS